jgi:DHA1 family bicyclomycin/chloramphenicol resistance-like MFS transporter
MKPRLASLNEVTTSIVSAILIALGPVSLSLYTPGLPRLVEAFHTTPAAVRASLTIYFFGFCIAQLVCGPMSDAFGRRPVAITFFSLYLVGSLVCLFAPTIGVLQVGRAMQGIGAAAGISTARAIVRDLFIGQASARIMNRISLIVGVVPALSPAVGSALLTYVGYQSLFVVMLLFAIVVVGMVIFIMPETNDSIDHSLARPDHILSSYATLLGDARFMGPSLIMGFILGGLYTLPSLLPFVLIETLGLTPIQYGVAMIVQTATLVVGNFIVARLLRTVNARRLVPIGIAIVMVSGLGFLLVWLFHAWSIAMVILPCSIWCFGLPFVTPGTLTSALSHFPRIAGAASALVGFMQMGGGLVGSAIAAGLFHEPISALGVLLPIAAGLTCITYFALPMESAQPVEPSSQS